MIEQLKSLYERFSSILPLDEEEEKTGVFLFKISEASRPKVRSYRLPLEKILFFE
jgi:hypothetical protein